MKLLTLDPILIACAMLSSAISTLNVLCVYFDRDFDTVTQIFFEADMRTFLGSRPLCNIQGYSPIISIALAARLNVRYHDDLNR